MKTLQWVGVGILVSIAAIFGLYLFEVGHITELAEPIDVIIEDNSGTEGTIQILYDKGLIPSRWATLMHIVLTGKRTELKAGQYRFEGNITIDTVLSTITQEKDYVQEVEITILEGWNNAEIGEYLHAAGVADYDKFISAADTKHTQTILPDNDYGFITSKHLTFGLQGYLFPDTYRIFEGETEIGIIEKMLTNFDSKFTEEMRAELANRGISIHDAVVMASIIEKEVQNLEDKQVVSGIFWKRINDNYPLQSDATINYATGKDVIIASDTDLEVESVFNTYRNTGLPPAPITNPGYDSLYAAVFPTESEYYFFLTTPDVDVVYSTNYDEHLIARAKYYE